MARKAGKADWYPRSVEERGSGCPAEASRQRKEDRGCRRGRTAPSEPRRPWAKVREPEAPADPNGPALARVVLGTLGPEAREARKAPQASVPSTRVLLWHNRELFFHPLQSPGRAELGAPFSGCPQNHFCPACASAAPPRVRCIAHIEALKGSDLDLSG